MDQKQFGVWMDGQHATVIGPDAETGALKVLAQVTSEEVSPSPSNKNMNNQKIMHQAKFFKEISSYLTNATHLHATGTGQAQEQFMHYLADTPQFKHTKTEESTANKMSDERLVEFFSEKFN
ncbi:MAG: hypothetical protein ABIO79_06260 [Ferruginibacter sp.]